MRICFNGCSLTYGVGVSAEQSYPSLIASDTVKTTNIAIRGSSNYTIFMRSANALLSSHYDIVVTQWSSLNRMWLSPGPDCDFFVNDAKNADFKYRDLYLSPSKKKSFTDTLLLMNHDYKNIFELVDYCYVLSSIAKLTQTRTIFVNGLVPWKEDLVRPLPHNLSTGLSNYTKSILDFVTRDDEEIIYLFSQLQQKFSKLDQELWVNLFESFSNNQVDFGLDQLHPGPESHKQMADKISNYLKI